MVPPWEWRPSSAAKIREILAALGRWRPHAELRIDRKALIHAARKAAADDGRWLLHPCTSAVTIGGEAGLVGDLQLALLIAGRSDVSATVRVPRPLMVWSPVAGIPVTPGEHVLRDLAKQVEEPWPWTIHVDVWCRSPGVLPLRTAPLLERTWAQQPPADSGDEAELERDVKILLNALSILETTSEGCTSWVSGATKVIVPLRREAGVNRSCSGSMSEVPGLVYVNVIDEVQVLEALIHESAHQYLFMAEAQEPLVDPAHTGTYRSPLRREPRPLRGILLAYHAIAYMSAFYADALDTGLSTRARLEPEIHFVLSKLADAEQTLRAGERFLTEAGREFVAVTAEIANHATAHSPS